MSLPETACSVVARAHYDPLIAKIIVCERDRPAADERQPLVRDDQEAGEIGVTTRNEDLPLPENAFGLELAPGAAAGAANDGQVV